MVVIGLYITRYGVGIGRYTINLIYGPIAYFFLALAGLLVIESIHRRLDVSPQNVIRQYKEFLLIVTLFTIGTLITTYNVWTYYLDVSVIIFIIGIAILWSVLWIYGVQARDGGFTSHLIVTLSFTLGLLYATILNGPQIPIYAILFFLTVSFLQLAREIIKSKTRNAATGKENSSIENKEDQNLKNVLGSLFLSLTFLIISIFSGICNPIFYLYFMLAVIFFMGFAIVRCWQSFRDRRNLRHVPLFLWFGILFELIAFILAI